MIRLPDHLSDEQISEECKKRTAELRYEMQHDRSHPAYDGSIQSLIACYIADPTSSIHSVKHSTRVRDYEPSLRVLAKNVGNRSILNLRASDFKDWFANWQKVGHRRASGAVKLLRIVLSYGTGERLPGCSEAREILSLMKFEQPAARTVAMTYDQCREIMQKSVELGYPSIGFVEALKFETALRRIDVIGEWIPNNEGGPLKWHGLIAENISEDLILKLTTSKTKQPVVRDMKQLPLVMEAMIAYPLPRVGPLVINETTNQPYHDDAYVRKFAKIRTKAGLPANVWSMDTRAGAVSETIAATGSLERAKILATHTTVKMTERYARGDKLEESRKIAEARRSVRLPKTTE